MSLYCDVAIVGGGYTGVVLAIHLMRSDGPPLNIHIFEPNELLGRGVAYGTDRDEHRVNVPNDRMWILADRKDDFAKWMAAKGIETADDDGKTAESVHYARRRDFSIYLRDLLNQTTKGTGRHRLTHEIEGVIDVSPGADNQFEVQTGNGGRYGYDAVAIAASYGAPSMPFTPDGDVPAGSIVRNPWSPGALETIDPAGDVLIVGTGLTMADTVTTLVSRGHTGKIVAVSRHGLLPQVHGEFDGSYDFLEGEPVPRTASGLFRLVRRRLWEVDREGHDWHRVIDSVRRQLPVFWPDLPLAARRGILRHLRSLWDVHRFRIAPPVAKVLGAAVRSQQLEIVAGRIGSVTKTASGLVRAEIRRRHGGRPRWFEVDVAAIVNCTGPTSDVTRSANPLFEALLRSGLARPDPLRIGFDIDHEDTILDREGERVEGFFVAGPLARGRYGETVGVPDASMHAMKVAGHLVDHLERTNARQKVPTRQANKTVNDERESECL